MTTRADARSTGLLRRRSALLAGVLLLAATAGTTVWFACRSAAPLTPPPVPADQNEPDVTAFLEKSRQRVLKEPRSAQAWGSLGQAFLANLMEEESRICFAEAERLDPSNPRWPYYQGGMLFDWGDRESALPYLQRAVARCAVTEPDNSVPRSLLAEILLALGRVEEAEEHFHQVLRRQPDDPRAHFGLALAASARQDWPTSRTHLLRCLNSPFTRQKARVQLAAVSQRLGDQAEADKYRQQADQLEEDSAWDDPFITEYLRWSIRKKERYRLIESLEAAKRFREAADALQSMEEQYPNDYLPRVMLGKILSQLGEHHRAVSVLREGLRLEPNKIQAHYYLSMVLLLEGDELAGRGERDAAKELFREAAVSARQALAVNPDFGSAHMTLGVALKRLGQRADALAAFRQAIHCNPEMPQLHYLLGEMLSEEGQKDEARGRIEKAVQMAPPDAPWLETARALLAAIRTSTDPKNRPGKPNE